MKQQEFIALVMPFKDRLYRIARRFLVSNDEAEDAVQEVYLKLWKGKDAIHTYGSAEAFAITMTKNYCLDRLKSKQAGNLKIVHNNFETKRQLENELDTKDTVAIVFKLMEDLPEQQRLIMHLRDVEQLEFHEIAEIVGSNETAIRVGLSRARKKIRAQLVAKQNYGIR